MSLFKKSADTELEVNEVGTEKPAKRSFRCFSRKSKS